MKNQLLICLICLLTLPVFSQAQSGSTAYYVQIASFTDPQMKQFENISKIGYLFSDLQDNGLYRVLMGTYSSYNEAKKVLLQIQAKGFKDAFIVQNAISDDDGVYIVQMGTLEQTDPVYWPNWQRLNAQIVVQLSDKQIRVASGPYYSQEDANQVMAEILKKGGRKDMFVRRVSQKVLHALSPLEIQRNDVNPKAERFSIKAMQTALSREGLYKDPIDGRWGNNTLKALDAFKAKDALYQQTKATAQAPLGKPIEQFTLQYYINLIDENPVAADEGLKGFQHPLAKVYRAYMYLNNDVANENTKETVNALMNEAATQTFKGYRLKTRYDFSMKYDYDNIEQLIKHLRAIHEAVKDEPDVPCWLFRRHPAVAATAFAPYWGNERDAYNVSSDCGSFLDLPQVQTLLAMSSTILGTKNDQLYKINQLYAFPQPLTLEEMKAMETWHGDFWKKVEAKKDKNTESFRMAYFDALRGVEDYFLKKYFSAQDARSLGLKTMQLILDPKG